ncbi:MAG: SsrA-binding protein SmpB [Thermodesulfobacteriota bacterium]
MAEKTEKPGVKVVATNRRARHEYEILETFECGLALQGYEVKSIREGRANIADGFAAFRDGEVFVENVHITPYSHGDQRFIDPLRVRKLLLNRKEIDYLHGKVKERGFTVIPLKMYFKGPHVKLEVGLARGKKLYDKRHDIAERDAKRDIERATRSRGKRDAHRD